MKRNRISIVIDREPVGRVMTIKTVRGEYRFHPYATPEDALVAAEAWVRANPEACK